MLRHGSSRNKRSRRRQSLLKAVLCLLHLLLAACGSGQAPAGSGAAGAVAPGLYAVDALAPSLQAPGIEMHLRYAERAPTGLVVHLAFYNNGPNDLAVVRGADPAAARLRGDDAEPPSAYSASLEGGIAPAGAWLAGGATNGTLTFARARGAAFTFEFPGFEAVPFRLDMPLRQAPEPAPAPVGTYTYGNGPAGGRSGQVAIERATVDERAVEIVVALPDAAEEFVDAAADVQGAVLLDSRWNQYPVAQAAAPAGDSTSPTPVSATAGTRRVALRFEGRPVGDVLLLRVPPFPLVRVPLRPGQEAAPASAVDLPPSRERRPAPVPAGDRTDSVTGEQQAIEQLVAELGRRIAARDRQGYLNAFAPEMRDEQARVFDRILALPLSDVGFTLEAGVVPDEDGQNRGAQVTLRYRAGDAAAVHTYSHDLALDLRRDADVWQITAVRGDLPFWLLGPTEARRTGAFTIFFRPLAESQLRAVEEEVAAALQQVGERLSGRVPASNVMFVTETADEFARLTGRDPARFAGVALSRYRIAPEGVTIEGSAFYINGAAFDDSRKESRQQTIAHELVHLALAEQTMPYTPVWAVEGMAIEVAEELPAETMRAAVQAGKLQGFDLAEFTARRGWGAPDQSGAETALDYAFAAYLTRYLVDRYGFDRFVAFYDSFATVPWARLEKDLPVTESEAVAESAFGTLARDLTAAQLQTAYGLDLATLERDFLAWVETEAT